MHEVFDVCVSTFTYVKQYTYTHFYINYLCKTTKIYSNYYNKQNKIIIEQTIIINFRVKTNTQ